MRSPPKLSLSGEDFPLLASPFEEVITKISGDKAVIPPCQQKKQNLSRLPPKRTKHVLCGLCCSVALLLVQVVLFPVVSVLQLRQFHEPPVSPRAVCMAGVCCDKILTGRRKEGFILWLLLSLSLSHYFSGGRYKKGHILM